MQDIPFFMTNDSWYYFDGKRFVLKRDAPEEAKKSIEEFYKTEKEIMGYDKKNRDFDNKPKEVKR